MDFIGKIENQPEILLLVGCIALLFVFIKNRWVSNQPVGTEKMKTISNHIAKGAMSFLKAEYTVLIFFVFIVGGLLTYLGMGNPEKTSPLLGLSFLSYRI